MEEARCSGAAQEKRGSRREDCPSRKKSSKVSLPLFELHGPFFIVVDGAVFAFRAAERKHFLDDLRHGVGIGADRSPAGNTSERPPPALQPLPFFSPHPPCAAPAPPPLTPPPHPTPTLYRAPPP